MVQIYWRKQVWFINTKSVILVILLLSEFLCQSAFASRARLNALQNKGHLLDTEILFSVPTKVSELDPFVTIESGQTLPANSKLGSFASGLVVIDTQSSMAVAFGRQNDLSSAQRTLYNQLMTESFELSANPIHLVWSSKNRGQSFAFGLYHSASKDNLSLEAESSEVLHAGYRMGFITFSAALSLVNDAQTTVATKKLTIADSGSLSVLYEIDNLVLSGTIENFLAQQKNAGVDVNSIHFQKFQMALSDRTISDETQFFYRVDLLIKNLKYRVTGVKERQNQVPLTLGIESNLNEWLLLRSSIVQTILVNQSENVPAAGNFTEAAFGLGLKFKKMSIDGTLSGLIGPTQTGAVSPNQFLTQVALTSIF